MDYRKTKSNWMRPSLNPMGPNVASAGRDYHPRAPWGQQSEELVEDFEASLRAMDADVKPPWEHEDYELQLREAERRKAEGYRFHSLFEVPPLTAQKAKQIADYKINPPFRCAYNEVHEPLKTAKKLVAEKNELTRKPWTYGQLPVAAPPSRRAGPSTAPTALWEVPHGDQASQGETVLAASGDPVLDSLRRQLLQRGAAGIAGLARKFRIFDDNNDRKLDMNEFCKGMKECEIIDLSDKAIQHLFRYFDRDDSGSISFDEFLIGLRGVLNDRRRDIVHQAFRVLDEDGSGTVDVDELARKYSAQAHPDFLAGRRSEKEILREFLENFRGGSTGGDVVTLEDFERYYANLSASIDDDDYFELVVRNAWRISGGEGWCANTANKRILVTHADGRETVEEEVPTRPAFGLRNGGDENSRKGRTKPIPLGTALVQR